MAPSPVALSLPDSLEQLLLETDLLNKDFDETEFSYRVERKLQECGDLDDSQRKAAFAEIAALQMPLKAARERSRWGTRSLAVSGNP
jgi:hypothetical protein